jgi:hypothetical protein
MHPDRPLSRTALLVAGGGIGILALAGCGSSGGSAATPTTATSALAGGGVGQAGGPAPGVSGTVAAIDGSTLQVQGSDEQTAVVWTKKTTVTTRVTTTSSALAIGDCVSVRTDASTSPTSSSPTAAMAGTGPLPASTVTILSTGGGCESIASGDGGGGGRFPGGGAGMPSGAPSGMPPGGGGLGATGEVTALSPGTFTVASLMPTRPPGTGTATARPTASPSSTPVTVTYGDHTTFLTTAAASATSIKVGSCVRATGKTDDTGTLTATTLVLSRPVDGSCTAGVRGG